MVWFLICSACVVALAMLAMMAVALILSADDDVTIFSDKHPVHAPAEPARWDNSSATTLRVLGDAVEDAIMAPSQIAQDATPAHRRESGRIIPIAYEQARDDDVGAAMIIPFGLVDLLRSQPTPGEQNPAPMADDDGGIGGIGGGHVIEDVGGDW